MPTSSSHKRSKAPFNFNICADEEVNDCDKSGNGKSLFKIS